MELLIPGIALAGLYTISKSQEKKKKESFTDLPNVNIPDVNYGQTGISTETEQTAKLTSMNRYDTPSVYTDKYFPEKLYPKSTSSAPYYSMTGEKVNANYFEHNNMTPFFGAKRRSSIVSMNATEGVLDSYSGAGTHFVTKQENSPLFSPGEHLNYAYGAPNQNDFYQSRVNPSWRQANVKPFQEERVAPGLGLGYTTEGQGGYNSGMAMRDAWMDKNVDDLRVKSKQKASGIGMLGHEGPANSHVKNISDSQVIGRVEKNRVERAFDITPDRYFVTTGVEKKPGMIPLPVERFTNRPETSISYVGAAGGQEESYRAGEYMPSKHMDLGAMPWGVPTGKAGVSVGSSEKAYPNNRSIAESETYFGAFSGAIGAVIAPLLDELRPSKKSNAIGTLRPYQNPQSRVTAPYLFDPGDRPAPTIRETTEVNHFVAGVNSNQNGGAYQVAQQQPVSNERSTTTDFFYAGNASASDRTKSLRPYDAEYRQRNNDIKSSTIQGYMVQGNMKLMNNEVNVRNRDGEIKNTRALGKTAGPVFTPSLLGESSQKSELYSTIQLDRNTPDILDAFRKNPYTHSLTNIP